MLVSCVTAPQHCACSLTTSLLPSIHHALNHEALHALFAPTMRARGHVDGGAGGLAVRGFGLARGGEAIFGQVLGITVIVERLLAAAGHTHALLRAPILSAIAVAVIALAALMVTDLARTTLQFARDPVGRGLGGQDLGDGARHHLRFRFSRRLVANAMATICLWER